MLYAKMKCDERLIVKYQAQVILVNNYLYIFIINI